MSHAQIYHARKEMKARGLTAAQISPRIVQGNITQALSPLVMTLGGCIKHESGLSITVRLNNGCSHSALTLGGLVAGLVGIDGTLCTQISPCQVLVSFDGSC